MARFLQSCIRDVTAFIDIILNGTRRWPPPGLIPCLSMPNSTVDFRLEGSAIEHKRSVPTNRLSELLGIEWGTLWGQPISKRTRDTVYRRMKSPHRLFAPKRNLVACQHCGSWHELHTICGECYKKVREETQVIKKRLLAYDPYKGELPDKEAFLVYQGEQPPADGTSKDLFGSEQRIIEMDKPRPSWFSADLKKRWGNLTPFVYKKPKE